MAATRRGKRAWYLRPVVLVVPGLVVCRVVTFWTTSASRPVPAGGEQASISLFKSSVRVAKQEDHFGAMLRSQLRKKGVQPPASTERNIKRVLHIGRFPRMWKDEWVGPADLARAGLRIDGMETYAIVA